MTTKNGWDRAEARPTWVEKSLRSEWRGQVAADASAQEFQAAAGVLAAVDTDERGRHDGEENRVLVVPRFKVHLDGESHAVQPPAAVLDGQVVVSHPGKPGGQTKPVAIRTASEQNAKRAGPATILRSAQTEVKLRSDDEVLGGAEAERERSHGQTEAFAVLFAAILDAGHIAAASEEGEGRDELAGFLVFRELRNVLPTNGRVVGFRGVGQGTEDEQGGDKRQRQG